jgi:hypothetical protein
VLAGWVWLRVSSYDTLRTKEYTIIVIGNRLIYHYIFIYISIYIYIYICLSVCSSVSEAVSLHLEAVTLKPMLAARLLVEIENSLSMPPFLPSPQLPRYLSIYPFSDSASIGAYKIASLANPHQTPNETKKGPPRLNFVARANEVVMSCCCSSWLSHTSSGSHKLELTLLERIRNLAQNYG